MEDRLRRKLNEAELKAWDALSRYKFQMFGYWAALWVTLNQVGGFKRPNPFKDAVNLAQKRQEYRARNLARIGLTERDIINHGGQHD